MATQPDQPGVMLYWEAFDLLNELGPAETKDALTAVYQYAKDGTEPDFGGNRVLRITWIVLKGDIDRNRDRYEQVREARRAAGKASAEKRSQQADEQKATNPTNVDFVEQGSTNSNKTQQKATKPTIITETITETETETETEGSVTRAKRFTPPTADDVRAYCREKGLELDAERFVDYYASRGWMVGKAKMKDWRAAARNWAREDAQKPATGKRDVSAGIYGHDMKPSREELEKLQRMAAKIRGE